MGSFSPDWPEIIDDWNAEPDHRWSREDREHWRNVLDGWTHCAKYINGRLPICHPSSTWTPEHGEPMGIAQALGYIEYQTGIALEPLTAHTKDPEAAYQHGVDCALLSLVI